MLAVKENREYTINDTDVQSFANEGYDVFDDKGNLIAYGKGKTVSYDKYMKVVEQTERLQDEIIELREQIKSLENAEKSATKKKGTK